MPKQQKRQKPHDFANVPEFDKAMRKLVDVPKEAVNQRKSRKSGEKR